MSLASLHPQPIEPPTMLGHHLVETAVNCGCGLFAVAVSEGTPLWAALASIGVFLTGVSGAMRLYWERADRKPRKPHGEAE